MTAKTTVLCLGSLSILLLSTLPARAQKVVEWQVASLEKLGAMTFGARVFGSALGRIARESVERCGLRRLGISGGDTSGFAARALGIEAMEMIAPMMPGAPLCRVHAPGSAAHGLEVTFKGGQIGGGDYFTVLRRGRP